MSKEKYEGFAYPERNYFRLPNDWSDITISIKSLAELKVIEYVLRHTWGYTEYKDDPKVITLDEFQHGRKTKNGRMDRGTGLNRVSIIRGIKRAIEDGFLTVETDDGDKGRIKKKYKLNMRGRGCESETSGVAKVYPRGCESIPQGLQKCTPIRERHLGKTLKEKESMSQLDSCDGHTLSETSEIAKRNNLPSEFDKRCARELSKVVSTVIKVNRNANLNKWANHFRLMRTKDKIPKRDIRETIQWYSEHIDDDFAIEAFSAQAFRRKYNEGKFAAAKRRLEKDQVRRNGENTNGNGKYVQTELDRVKAEYWTKHGFNVTVFQDKLDVILVDMGLEPGSYEDRDI